MNDFSDELLSAYLDDELSSEERAEVEAAMEADPDLRRTCDELKALSGTLRAMPKSQPMSDWAETVLQRVNESAAQGDVDAGSSPFAVAPTKRISQRSKLPLYLVAGVVGSLAAMIVVMVAISGNMAPQIAQRDAATDATMAPAAPFDSDLSAGSANENGIPESLPTAELGPKEKVPIESEPMMADSATMDDLAAPSSPPSLAKPPTSAPGSQARPSMMRSAPIPSPPNAIAADKADQPRAMIVQPRRSIVVKLVIERGSRTELALNEILSGRKQIEEQSIDERELGDLVRSSVDHPVLSRANEVFVIKTTQVGVRDKLALLQQQPLLEKSLEVLGKTRTDSAAETGPNLRQPRLGAVGPPTSSEPAVEKPTDGTTKNDPALGGRGPAASGSVKGGGAGGRATTQRKATSDEVVFRTKVSELLKGASKPKKNETKTADTRQNDANKGAGAEHLIIIVEYSNPTAPEE